MVVHSCWSMVFLVLVFLILFYVFCFKTPLEKEFKMKSEKKTEEKRRKKGKQPLGLAEAHPLPGLLDHPPQSSSFGSQLLGPDRARPPSLSRPNGRALTLLPFHRLTARPRPFSHCDAGPVRQRSFHLLPQRVFRTGTEATFGGNRSWFPRDLSFLALMQSYKGPKPRPHPVFPL